MCVCSIGVIPTIRCRTEKTNGSNRQRKLPESGKRETGTHVWTVFVRRSVAQREWIRWALLFVKERAAWRQLRRRFEWTT